MDDNGIVAERIGGTEHAAGAAHQRGFHVILFAVIQHSSADDYLRLGGNKKKGQQ